MLRHFCTFAQRTCRANTRRQLRQCTDIPGDSFVKTSTRIRNYCESKATIIDEKSNKLSPVKSRLKTYWSTDTDSKIKNDKENVETNDCTRVKKIETITAVPELLNTKEIRTLDENIELRLPDALDKCTEDVSDVVPYTDPPMTFAYIAESSNAIQQLIKLGVKLYKLERNEDLFKAVSQFDFDRDIKPKIQFLCDNGVQPADIGNVINRFPRILTLNLKIPESKILYFQRHKFSMEEISMILTKRAEIIGIPIRVIHERLTSIQQIFKLTEKELRGLASHQPRIITCEERKVLFAVGYIKDVLKFNKFQMKQLLLLRPSVYVKYTGGMVDTCMYAMQDMQMKHEDIIKHNQILVCKKYKLECRHKFLVELNKAQYDPSLPGYIPPSKIVMGNDEQFCEEVANCDVNLYSTFLKTI